MSDLVSIIIPTRNRAEDILKCLSSIHRSSYKSFEVIVVDNASTDNTVDLIKTRYPSVRLVCSEYNRMAVGGRNLGIGYARGNYLLFIDSDNEIDPEMISNLVNAAESDHSIGLVGPKVYYYSDRNRIWCAGVDINLLTGQTIYLGNNQIDRGQFDKIREVGHIPNVFMARREALLKAGGKLDDVYKMSYGESDLAMNIKKAGFRVVIIPEAKTYHKTVPPGLNARSFGFDTQERIYYLIRNKVIFMKRHAPILNFIFYILYLYPIYIVYFAIKILRYKPDIFPGFIKGVLDAYLYLFK